MATASDVEARAMTNGPLATFFSSLRAELPPTDVQIVVDNAAARRASTSRISPSCRCHEEAGRHSQKANRWQTEMPSASDPYLLERAGQQPLARRLGPAMPQRRRSLDADDDTFCQAIRECAIRNDPPALRIPPQRVCSSELAVEALFHDKARIRSPSPWETNERACPTG